MKLLSTVVSTLVLGVAFSNSFAMINDPCEAIGGNWKGTIRNGNCVWDTFATFERYQETVRFELHNYNGRGGNCRGLDTVYTGICKNALITLGDGTIKGTIFGNKVSLQDSYGSSMELFKS